MPLIRHPNWDTEPFHEFLVAEKKVPFEWGVRDCCLFAADAIQSFTGVDIADDFRGKYHDEASAFALIKSLTGGDTVADAAVHCAAKHGLVEHTFPKMAKRGDLVVVQNADGGLIAGVVNLNGAHLVSVTDRGIVRLPIGKIVRSWSV